jgi:hypothetical protein
MHTTLLLCSLLFGVCAGYGQVIDCPDTGAVGRCFAKYDLDGDSMLSVEEFDNAYDSVSWYVRWSLDSPETYFERCDQNKDKKLTPFELLSSECIPYCAEQRALYNQMC